MHVGDNRAEVHREHTVADNIAHFVVLQRKIVVEVEVVGDIELRNRVLVDSDIVVEGILLPVVAIKLEVVAVLHADSQHVRGHRVLVEPADYLVNSPNTSNMQSDKLSQ
jgi:hypothetical protein